MINIYNNISHATAACLFVHDTMLVQLNMQQIASSLWNRGCLA